MPNQTELQLIITAQNKAMGELAKLNKDVQGLSQSSDKSNKSFSGLLPNLALLGGAYAFVKKGIIDSVKAFDESEKVIAEMNAVLKSTGGVSGMTSESMTKLASDLQNVSTFDDEAILHTENLILTFNQMGKDIIPQVTESIMDLAQMMGGDLQGATMQVAKAMQDPERGLMMLRKSGVSFNDEQVKTIKHLYETGKAMEGQKMILQELQKEFGGQARAALETFGGRMKWLQNQIQDAQEGIGKAIVNSVTVALSGADLSTAHAKKVLDDFKNFFMKWIPAFVIGLKWFAQMFWDACKFIGTGLYNAGNIIVAFVKDAIYNFTNLGEKMKTIFGGLSKALHGDFEGALADVSAGVEYNTQNMTNALNEGMANSADLINNFANDTNSALDSINEAWKMNGENTKSVGSGVAQVQDYVGKSASEMASKYDEAKKKISDLKKEFSDAVKEAKQSMKDLTEQFNSTEVGKSNELGTNIAKEIIGKLQEQKDLQAQINTETDEDKKKSLQTQLDAVDDFLTKHKDDTVAYATQIAEENRKAGLDAIELLKEQYQVEKDERLKEYGDKMKDLKQHLKEVKQEYKDKLKELKDEIKKDGLDNITINISAIVKQISSGSNSKRATGGTVTAGNEYLVGESGAELFVPNVSGTIVKNGQYGKGANVNNFNFNFSGAFIGNRDDLIREIERTINRKQELTSMGAI